MDAIVSVTGDWGIGYRGRLLVPNHQDMRRFRELTEGGTVICGRTTFGSFPNGALPNRLNIIISGDSSLRAEGALVTSSVQDAVQMAEREAYGNGRIWVIGGASIYRQMLPLCRDAYVTKHGIVTDADTFFPNLDDDPEWHVAEEQGGGVTSDGVPFRFLRYSR